jgi:hydrogenase expression/formation protein HypE
MGAIPANIHWGAQTLSVGDVLLVSGTLGDHGATILNLREQLGLDGELVSDCAVLTPLIQTLRDIPGVKALRDATRGGVNAVTHEFAASCGFGIELSEAALPVKPAVRGVCELLGLDALNFANEGKLVIAVERQAAETACRTARASIRTRCRNDWRSGRTQRCASGRTLRRETNPRFTTRRTFTSYMPCPLAATCRPDKRNRYPAIIYDLYL